MTRHPRRLIAISICLAVIATAGVAVFTARAEEPGQKSTFVLNLTSGQEDLHSVVMGLALAGHALDDGRRVVVFCNVRAPELLRKDLPATTSYENEPPVPAMIADLVKRGAEIQVCPLCMRLLGVPPDNLIPEARVATRDSLFSRLGPQTIVFTY